MPQVTVRKLKVKNEAKLKSRFSTNWMLQKGSKATQSSFFNSCLGTFGWGLKFSMFDPYSASGKEKLKFKKKLCELKGYGD